MKVYPDFLLHDILWYKIGGKARFLIEVKGKQDIKNAYEFLRKQKDLPAGRQVKKVFFLGLGSNLIFTDDYFDGAILRFLPNNNSIKLTKPHLIHADAGTILDDVIQFGFQNNLVGLEWAGGLPGNVGAAVRGNVGAFGGEIKDVIKDIEVFEAQNGKPRFKNFATPEHVEKILNVYPDLEEKIKRDWYGKVSMGYLIKRLDLSGYRIGNAMISPKHCNFIVNLGGARARDVLSIIKVIEEKFLETFDFTPEVEAEVVE